MKDTTIIVHANEIAIEEVMQEENRGKQFIFLHYKEKVIPGIDITGLINLIESWRWKIYIIMFQFNSIEKHDNGNWSVRIKCGTISNFHASSPRKVFFSSGNKFIRLE
jgi:hypothetical protein